MTLQEKEAIKPTRPTPAGPNYATPLTDVDPRTTTATGQESVYAAKDVEPTASPAVAREGEVLAQQNTISPLAGFGVLVVLIVVIYLLYLLFT